MHVNTDSVCQLLITTRKNKLLHLYMLSRQLHLRSTVNFCVVKHEYTKIIHKLTFQATVPLVNTVVELFFQLACKWPKSFNLSIFLNFNKFPNICA